MTDSGIQAPPADPEIHSDAAIPFRFEVSWRSLTQPERLTQIIESEGSFRTERSLPSRVETLRSQPVPPAAKPVDIFDPSYGLPSTPSLHTPSFGIATDYSSTRKWATAVSLVLLLVAVVFAAVRRMDQPSSASDETPTATMEMGGAGWSSEWVSDKRGSSLGRQISLYRPSLLMSNYRLVFSGRIERKSLGWVFRTADSRNYYGGKLQVSQPGAPLTLSRFAVIRGVEGPHIQSELPHISSAGVLKVRLDAKGSRFTIYVQNQVVADWEDDRLKTGGVGFLSEREERGHVDSVQISF